MCDGAARPASAHAQGGLKDGLGLYALQGIGRLDEVNNLNLPRLRDLREDHDLTQTKIANLLGIDQRVYSNYETGKREIPVRHLITLADFYHVTVDYILGREAGDL